MTKTGVQWEAIVPPQAEPVLRRYIEDVRPFLIARGHLTHNVLWVGKKGEIIGQIYIGTRIGTLTKNLTGQRVPPHFFRDAAATTLARMSPESARLIPPVLAHSGFRTAERHYIHAQTIDAGRDYASLLRRLKGDRSRPELLSMRGILRRSRAKSRSRISCAFAGNVPHAKAGRSQRHFPTWPSLVQACSDLAFSA
jgi:hypothetical protein